MKRLAYCILAGGLFALPFAASASVVINEIDWMGTADNANAEWIELYNPDSAGVDLNGWTLKAQDGSPSITLTGTIAAGGYYLLERTSDDTVPDVAMDQSYSGSLSNSGELLALKDASGNEIDSVDGSEGWQKGNNDTKETMQRNGDEWITAAGTPKAENSIIDDSANPSDDNSDATSTSSSSQTPSSHSSSASLSTTEHVTITLSKGRDRLASIGSPIGFSTQAFFKDGSEANADYRWSMGDGDTENGREITHTYQYPGTYVVVVNATNHDNEAVARMEVTVVKPDLKIVHADSEEIQIENDSDYEQNLGGWELSDGSDDFTFPQDTIILPQSTLIFPESITGVSGDSVRLENPNGENVTSQSGSTTSAVSETLFASSSDPVAALEEAKSEVAKLALQVESLSPPSQPRLPVMPYPSPHVEIAVENQSASQSQDQATATESASPGASQTASAYEIYHAEEPDGAGSGILKWLERLFGR
jgi:hypothetical protein